MNQTDVFVGIDVAKARLDVALHPSGETWTVPNDEAGGATLVAQLQQRRVALIVLECQRSCNNPQLWSSNSPHPLMEGGGDGT